MCSFKASLPSYCLDGPHHVGAWLMRVCEPLTGSEVACALDGLDGLGSWGALDTLRVVLHLFWWLARVVRFVLVLLTA